MGNGGKHLEHSPAVKATMTSPVQTQSMKILFLSRWFPYPANNGSKLRIYNLLRNLSKHYDVTLLSFIDPSVAVPCPSFLQDLCSQFYTVPWREYDPKSRRARVGLLRSKPRSLQDTHSPQMDAEIRRLISINKYNLVIASQLTMASYCDAYRDVPAIFEELELGSFHEAAYLSRDVFKRFRHLLTWLKLRAYVSEVLNAYYACTVASNEERDIFIGAFPQHQEKVAVIPNCIDIDQYRMPHVRLRPHHLIFSGSFRYSANYHAMVWFLNEVYPRILEHVPEAQLIITGDHANLPLPQIGNILRTGYVEDIKSLIASCEVSIAPIWSGGGTRLKILEAMAVGTPVVATSKGAEGLLAQSGEHLLIADEPERFARCVIRLLHDKDFSRQIASSAHQLVQDHYDWSKVAPRFLQLVKKATDGKN